MPNGVGTVFIKNRDNRAPGFITRAFVEVPMWPKSPQLLEAIFWQNSGERIWKTEFLSQIELDFAELKGFTRNTASAHHEGHYSTA